MAVAPTGLLPVDPPCSIGYDEMIGRLSEHVTEVDATVAEIKVMNMIQWN